MQSGQVAQNAVEDNLLSPEEYKRKVELINKAQGGANGLNNRLLAFLNTGSLSEKEAKEFLALVGLDKYSNQLLKEYVKNPKGLNDTQLKELALFINEAANGNPTKAQEILSNAKFGVGSADPFTGEQLNKAIIKAQQSISYSNSMDKKLAEAAEPGLFALTGGVGSVIRYAGALAGSYNIGQGTAKIVDGKYTEGVVQVAGGALLVLPSAIEVKGITNRINNTSVQSSKSQSTQLPPSQDILYPNLYPNHAVALDKVPRELFKDQSGRYWLKSPNGNLITPSGKYDFVTMPNGKVIVARGNISDESTHLGLSNGYDVKYAGTIRFTGLCCIKV